MQASRGTLVLSLLLCLFAAVLFTPTANGCERGFMGSWNFNGLRQLLQDNLTSEFRREAQMRRGLRAPSLQTLRKMFRDLEKGMVPRYIVDNDYVLISNSSGNFSYSSGNTGADKTIQFGVFQLDGDTAAYSTLDFLFVQGAVGKDKYEAGGSFFTHVLYTLGDTFVSFQASTSGAMLMKMPDGKYAANGNYTGLSQGNAMLFDDFLSLEVDTLGIFHTSSYYSLNEITVNGGGDMTNFTHVVDVVSMTGGTNSSLTFNSTAPTSAADNCTVPIVGSGILMNANKEAVLEAKCVLMSCDLMEASDPFSEDFLPHIFSLPRLAVDIYLP